MKWKFIVIGLLSTLFLILGFRQLFIAINPKILEAYYLYGTDMEKVDKHLGLAHDESFADVFLYYFLGLFAAGMIAWLVSMAISWTLAKKSGIPKINIILLAVATIPLTPLISKFHLDFHQLYFSFKELATVVGVSGTMLINGAILTSIGLFLVLSKKMKNHYYQQGA
ncbi:hypothetical protein GU926_17660 [Nibribacter ruber]|uniref:Uncharacterized protein n=1 Tax=Nibribacter ruber TaxID=2698458 RepID=A0A6P1P401_9BACT|nr:hypothetical protein [Nibribacter ruber]QHL89159.1 hypothetical protein GU926_17660 [Nibribacter ruber]